MKIFFYFVIEKSAQMVSFENTRSIKVLAAN